MFSERNHRGHVIVTESSQPRITHARREPVHLASLFIYRARDRALARLALVRWSPAL